MRAELSFQLEVQQVIVDGKEKWIYSTIWG
jgi:hypothetical protein